MRAYIVSACTIINLSTVLGELYQTCQGFYKFHLSVTLFSMFRNVKIFYVKNIIVLIYQLVYTIILYYFCL